MDHEKTPEIRKKSIFWIKILAIVLAHCLRQTFLTPKMFYVENFFLRQFVFGEKVFLKIGVKKFWTMKKPLKSEKNLYFGSKFWQLFWHIVYSKFLFTPKMFYVENVFYGNLFLTKKFFWKFWNQKKNLKSEKLWVSCYALARPIRLQKPISQGKKIFDKNVDPGKLVLSTIPEIDENCTLEAKYQNLIERFELVENRVS